jgi:hypothetical protein
MERIRLTNRKLFLSMGFGFALVAGIVVILITLASPTPEARIPDPGVYQLPQSEVSKVPPGETGSFSLTLAGGRYNEITIKDTHIGQVTGLTNVFEIGASTGSIYVDAMTVDGLTCPKFMLSSSEVHTATYTDNVADGNDFSLSGGSPSDITIQSERGGKSYVIDQDTYDKIKIDATADVEIAALVIQNVRAFGGICDFSDLKIGTLNVINSVVGTGDGIATKDFGFGSGVTIGSFTSTNNVETELDVR